MNNKFQLPKIFESLVPFLVAGVVITLFIGLLFMFSYVVVWGLIIGGLLWIATVVKQFLFPTAIAKTEIIKDKKGRIIEHDEKK